MFSFIETIAALNDSQDFHLGMHKFEQDVRRYERAIANSNPEIIVECGTQTGRSALWFAQFADVITIDVDIPPACHEDSITWITGSSIDPWVQSRVSDMVAGKRVLVSLDSDHSYQHVLAEMSFYSTLVQPGGYMVVEDGIVSAWFGQKGPLEAINDFFDHSPDNKSQWVVDSELCNMFPVSGSPSGYLRRIGE